MIGRTPGGMHDEQTAELLSELVEEGRHLVREEVHLARMELASLFEVGKERVHVDMELAREELAQSVQMAARAGGAIATGGVLTQAGVYLLLVAACVALATVLPIWLAVLDVGIAAGLVGVIVLYTGVRKIRRIPLAPRKAFEHLKEDGQWMSERLRELRSKIPAGV